MAKKKSTFFADFKKFITRGNVVDMAVGVIIGSSFNKIVTGLVNYIINPFIGLFLKSGDLDSIKTEITAPVYKVLEDGTVTDEIATPGVYIQWGTWIQTILDFLIVAFCLFMLLRIIMRTKNILEAKENEAKAAADAKAAEEAKIAAEKAKAEADAAAKAAAEKQAAFEASILAQEKLLTEIRDIMKNK